MESRNTLVPATRLSVATNPSEPTGVLARTLQTGVVTAHPKAFGFVTTESLEEHFIPPSLMRELVPGDSIEFYLESGKKPGAFQVASPRVVSRPETVWLGTLRYHRGGWVLEPDDACFATIHVPGVTFAAEGLVVSVRIPASRKGDAQRISRIVTAKLERILGERTRPLFDVDYAVARYDFEHNFSEAAVREAQALVQPQNDAPVPAGRKDLRHLPYVTIDGESTRDFDDAVWAEKLPQGWRVGVAIADVSHYVRAGTALNQDARARATSVYLPGRTFPMLPEALSNGVCSLLPGQDRYVVALELTLDEDAQVLSSTVNRTVIRSAKRLTYTDVNGWRANEFPVEDSVNGSLSALWSLFEKLAQLRRVRGQLDFDAPEPKVVDNGNGTALEWLHRTDAHKLVEEMMLLANQCIASRLQEQSRALFRHQPQPEAEDWLQLSQWAATKGATLPAVPSMKALAELRATVGAEQSTMADLQARSGMRPATYEALESSHFSLGYAAYTHFTSPIRRYADLLVHRLLLDDVTPTAAGMTELAAHCSKRSRDARMAERLVWDKIKKRTMFATAKSLGALPAHVVSQSRHGLRAVVGSWQASVMISGLQLHQAGYAYDAAVECWTSPSGSLELGSNLSVTLASIEEDKARTEVQAQLQATVLA